MPSKYQNLVIARFHAYNYFHLNFILFLIMKITRQFYFIWEKLEQMFNDAVIKFLKFYMGLMTHCTVKSLIQ